MAVIYPASTEDSGLPRIVVNGVMQAVSPAALKARMPPGWVCLAQGSFSRAHRGMVQHFRAGAFYVIDPSVQSALLASNAPIKAV